MEIIRSMIILVTLEKQWKNKEVHNMKTAQEFREGFKDVAIKAMSTPDMVKASKIVESLIYEAICESKNYIHFYRASQTYKDLCVLTKGYRNLKTYLELHGYTVSITDNFVRISF